MKRLLYLLTLMLPLLANGAVNTNIINASYDRSTGRFVLPTNASFGSLSVTGATVTGGGASITQGADEINHSVESVRLPFNQAIRGLGRTGNTNYNLLRMANLAAIDGGTANWMVLGDSRMDWVSVATDLDMVQRDIIDVAHVGNKLATLSTRLSQRFNDVLYDVGISTQDSRGTNVDRMTFVNTEDVTTIRLQYSPTNFTKLIVSTNGILAFTQSADATNAFKFTTSDGTVSLLTLDTVNRASIVPTTASYNSEIGSLAVAYESDLTRRMILGFDGNLGTHGSGFIAGIKAGVAWLPIIINAAGGNVGIGTIGPASKLDVIGDIRSSSAIFTNSVNSRTNIGTLDVSTNIFVLGTRYTNSNRRLFVSASIALTAAAAGTATVALYVENLGTATNSMAVSAGPLASLVTTEPLFLPVGPGMIYYFADETSGVGASATILGNRCSRIEW